MQQEAWFNSIVDKESSFPSAAPTQRTLATWFKDVFDSSFNTMSVADATDGGSLSSSTRLVSYKSTDNLLIVNACSAYADQNALFPAMSKIMDKNFDSCFQGVAVMLYILFKRAVDPNDKDFVRRNSSDIVSEPSNLPGGRSAIDGAAGLRSAREAQASPSITNVKMPMSARRHSISRGPIDYVSLLVETLQTLCSQTPILTRMVIYVLFADLTQPYSIHSANARSITDIVYAVSKRSLLILRKPLLSETLHDALTHGVSLFEYLHTIFFATATKRYNNNIHDRSIKNYRKICDLLTFFAPHILYHCCVSAKLGSMVEYSFFADLYGDLLPDILAIAGPSHSSDECPISDVNFFESILCSAGINSRSFYRLNDALRSITNLLQLTSSLTIATINTNIESIVPVHSMVSPFIAALCNVFSLALPNHEAGPASFSELVHAQSIPLRFSSMIASFDPANTAPAITAEQYITRAPTTQKGAAFNARISAIRQAKDAEPLSRKLVYATLLRDLVELIAAYRDVLKTIFSPKILTIMFAQRKRAVADMFSLGQLFSCFTAPDLEMLSLRLSFSLPSASTGAPCDSQDCRLIAGNYNSSRLNVPRLVEEIFRATSEQVVSPADAGIYMPGLAQVTTADLLSLADSLPTIIHHHLTDTIASGLWRMTGQFLQRGDASPNALRDLGALQRAWSATSVEFMRTDMQQPLHLILDHAVKRGLVKTPRERATTFRIPQDEEYHYASYVNCVGVYTMALSRIPGLAADAVLYQHTYAPYTALYGADIGEESFAYALCRDSVMLSVQALTSTLMSHAYTSLFYFMGKLDGTLIHQFSELQFSWNALLTFNHVARFYTEVNHYYYAHHLSVVYTRFILMTAFAHYGSNRNFVEDLLMNVMNLFRIFTAPMKGQRDHPVLREMAPALDNLDEACQILTGNILQPDYDYTKQCAKYIACFIFLVKLLFTRSIDATTEVVCKNGPAQIPNFVASVIFTLNIVADNVVFPQVVAHDDTLTHYPLSRESVGTAEATFVDPLLPSAEDTAPKSAADSSASPTMDKVPTHLTGSPTRRKSTAGGGHQTPGSPLSRRKSLASTPRAALPLSSPKGNKTVSASISVATKSSVSTPRLPLQSGVHMSPARDGPRARYGQPGTPRQPGTMSSPRIPQASPRLDNLSLRRSSSGTEALKPDAHNPRKAVEAKTLGRRATTGSHTMLLNTESQRTAESAEVIEERRKFMSCWQNTYKSGLEFFESILCTEQGALPEKLFGIMSRENFRLYDPIYLYPYSSNHSPFAENAMLSDEDAVIEVAEPDFYRTPARAYTDAVMNPEALGAKRSIEESATRFAEELLGAPQELNMVLHILSYSNVVALLRRMLQLVALYEAAVKVGDVSKLALFKLLEHNHHVIVYLIIRILLVMRVLIDAKPTGSEMLWPAYRELYSAAQRDIRGSSYLLLLKPL